MRDDPNAECGVRNAESKGKVVRLTTPTLTFRIPHFAFRILFLALLAGPAAAQVDPSGS